CNGLTERFNPTLADMISAFVIIRHSNWDQILPYLVHAYNTAVQSSTGYAPFFLVFARDPRTTLDTILPPAEASPSSDSFTVSRSALADDARRIARSRLQ